MTPREQIILDLMAAAEKAGLDPVVELPDNASPRSVDLRVMDGNRVTAAIRVRLTKRTWRYEVPARPQGSEWAGGGRYTQHLVDRDVPLTAEVLRPLDYYFARVTRLRSAAPKPLPHPKDSPAWMKVPV